MMKETCAKYERMIVLYIDNEIDKDLVDELLNHINICENCRNIYNSYVKNDKIIKNIFDVKLNNPYFETRINALIKLKEKKLKYWLWVPVNLSFIMILTVFILFYSFSNKLNALDFKNKSKVYNILRKCVISKNIIIPPISLLNFCRMCHSYMCDCAGKDKKCDFMEGK